MSAPSTGAGLRTRQGVALMLHGTPECIRLPTSGCSSLTRKPRWVRWESSARSLYSASGTLRPAPLQNFGDFPAVALRGPLGDQTVQFFSYAVGSGAVRKRGSSGSNGCPMAAHSACHSASLPTAMVTPLFRVPQRLVAIMWRHYRVIPIGLDRAGSLRIPTASRAMPSPAPPTSRCRSTGPRRSAYRIRAVSIR